jgi:hypothetical protein
MGKGIKKRIGRPSNGQGETNPEQLSRFSNQMKRSEAKRDVL